MRITEAIVIDDGAIEERFVRSMGSRSQNADKDETAVELRFDIGRSALPADVQARLRALGGRHVTSDDVLVVVSRAGRSQVENRESAHTRFAELVRRASVVPPLRKPTRPRRAAREDRIVDKKLNAEVKRGRAPVR